VFEFTCPLADPLIILPSYLLTDGRLPKLT